MKTSLILKGSSTGTISSTTVDLSAFANSAGTGRSLLKVTFTDNFTNGTVSGLTLYHSSDNTTWSTLWSIGSPSSATSSYKTFYSFYPYLYASMSYVAGTDIADPGTRIRISLQTYGIPDWPSVYICRAEDMWAIYPHRMDTTVNFELVYVDQLRAAKNQIEAMLVARGIDPDKLFTDGHITYPTVPGLRLAASFLVWYYINMDQSLQKNDDYYREMDWLWGRFMDEFDRAVSGGMLQQDIDDDADTDEGEFQRQDIIIYR